MIPAAYRKKSFRRFSNSIELEKIRDEFDLIPADEWYASYWGDIHCSVGMLLLRGGRAGAQEDFYCEEVHDRAILDQLPTISDLISERGPFGRAKYAFIFRMVPDGLTLVHRDTIERWHDMYRIHVPIYTNPDAYLISDNQSQHFEAGYAWSFDNQTRHGVVNGNEERVHLIFDVEWNEKLKQQIDAATFFPGEYIEPNVQAIHATEKKKASYFGDPVIRVGVQRLRSRGLSDQQIVDYFNSKQVPTKKYSQPHWDVTMIKQVVD